MTANAEHTLVVGTTGAGKSTLTETLLKSAVRVITLTTKLTDYEDGWETVNSFPDLFATLKEKWNEPSLRICFRVPCGPEDMETPVRELHRVSLLLHKLQMPYAERRDDRQIGLVVDEAHRFFPHHRPQGCDGFAWVVSEGRDWGINVLFATQRPTNIPPIFRDNATNLYVLMLGGDTAVESVKKFVGKDMVNPDKYRYALYRAGKLKAEGDTRNPNVIHKLP